MRIARVCGARSGLPADSLITSTAPTLTENEESRFWKGDKNEKNCSSTSPWTRGLRLNLESAGQTRTPPSARAPSQHKTMQEHATSPADWWEGRRRNRGCVWWGGVGRGKGDRGGIHPNLGGVIWCMRQCIVSHLNQQRKIEGCKIFWSLRRKYVPAWWVKQ